MTARLAASVSGGRVTSSMTKSTMLRAVRTARATSGMTMKPGMDRHDRHLPSDDHGPSVLHRKPAGVVTPASAAGRSARLRSAASGVAVALEPLAGMWPCSPRHPCIAVDLRIGLSGPHTTPTICHSGRGAASAARQHSVRPFGDGTLKLRGAPSRSSREWTTLRNLSQFELGSRAQRLATITQRVPPFLRDGRARLSAGR